MKKDDHGFGTKAVHAGEDGGVQEGEKGVFLYTRAGNPTLIRISAGLEDAKDIITDLKGALSAL